MDTLPALYMIFTLLNAFRRGIPRSEIWKEFRRQEISLRPRLSFWLALCIQAHLLADIDAPRVTRFAPQWLAMSPEAQAFHLLKAWQNAPKNRAERRFRRKVLWKLQWDRPLTAKDRRSINGLEALGLVKETQLTTWGRLLIKGEGTFPTPVPEQPWKIEGGQLVVSLSQRTDLAWQIERYLRPAAPGRYPLDERNLLRAVHQGSRETLIELLENGLNGSLPSNIRARILEQPTLQVLQGTVIEFSHPSDLEALRHNPNLRRRFEQVLSPRHVLIDTQDVPRVLQILARRGIELSFPQDQPARRHKRTHFSRTPLLEPTGKPVPMLQLLEKHIHLQQALDVYYRVPGCQVEQRRITPLLIEQRGEHIYISAYCQTRRANRLFRLDRMQIPGTVNEG
jgi:hypothetical protein